MQFLFIIPLTFNKPRPTANSDIVVDSDDDDDDEDDDDDDDELISSKYLFFKDILFTF